MNMQRLNKVGLLGLMVLMSAAGGGCRSNVVINGQSTGVSAITSYVGRDDGSLNDVLQGLESTYGASVQSVNFTIPTVELMAVGSYFDPDQAEDLRYDSRVDSYKTEIINVVNGAQALNLPFKIRGKTEVCKSTKKNRDQTASMSLDRILITPWKRCLAHLMINSKKNYG